MLSSMAKEVYYFPTDWSNGAPDDPKSRGLLGSLRRFFGGWFGPRYRTAALEYVTEEKVASSPQNVRLPWFLPYEEYDTGTGETQNMRNLYRKGLAFPPVKAALLNKVFGVAALKLQIHPADKRNDYDQQVADGVRWNLVRRLGGGVPRLAWNLLTPACLDGYSVNEKIWQTQDTGKYAGRIALTNLKMKDTGFDLVPKVDQFSNITSFLGLRYNGGKEFHPSDFVTYAHLKMYERPTGLSDLRAVFEAMWLYDTVWKLRRIGLTTKSFPFLKGMYEQESQQPGLNAALRKAKSLSFLTVPKGCMVEAIELAGGSADEFKNCIQDLREEILMGITGAFMHQMGAGQNVKRGSSEKAESVSDLFKWFLAEEVCGLLNNEDTGVIKEMVDLNHVVSEYPTASLDAISWEEMLQFANIIDKARTWGMPLSKEWLSEKLSLEAPHADTPGDALAPAPTPGAPGSTNGTSPPNGTPSDGGGSTVSPDTVDSPKGGTGGSPIDAEPHKFSEEYVAELETFAAKHGWEPAVRMGHRGGLKGGPARAQSLTKEEMHKIAVQGGKARQAGEHAIGVKKNADAATVSVLTAQPKVQQFAGGFDESLHPRDDHGQFVDKGELEAAKADLGKAQELRKKVTKPVERAKLEQHLKGADWYGKKGGAKQSVPYPETAGHALEQGKKFGVRIVEGASGTSVSKDQLHSVNEQVAKIPAKALEAVTKAGSGIDVVGGKGITDHPHNAHLKGVVPRGWEKTGKTWDDVPGGGAQHPNQRTIIAARGAANPYSHGSANLVLHEHGHTVDACSRDSNNQRPSDQADWKAIHGKVKWPSPYQQAYAEEAWAESFAKMYNGEQTRAALPPEVQAYFTQRFGT